MKVYIGIKRPISIALKQAFFDMMPDCDSSLERPEGAHLIIIENKQELQKMYSEKKFFAVLSIHEVENLPANARWIPVINFMPPLIEFMQEIESSLASRKQALPSSEDVPLALETGVEYPPLVSTAKSLKVLVIDDKPKNLQMAADYLGKDHYITLATGYDEGLQLIRTNTYDAVLSDCQMPPETKNSDLSLDAITIGQTVHNGLFLIFHATKRGARVAIVTDANHHQDWVSAIFDYSDIREPQVVNGQPVLLINYMGKRWDDALNALMAL